MPDIIDMAVEQDWGRFTTICHHITIIATRHPVRQFKQIIPSIVLPSPASGQYFDVEILSCRGQSASVYILPNSVEAGVWLIRIFVMISRENQEFLGKKSHFWVIFCIS